MNRTATIIPLLLLMLTGPAATAQSLKGAWIVCTRDLQLRETLIDRFDQRELVLRNEYGIRSSVPMGEVLFVVRSDPLRPVRPDEIAGVPMPEPSPVRLITLRDGQVIRGSIIEPGVPDELAISLIAGRHVHGEAHLPLERVMRVVDQDAPPPTQAPGELLDDLVITRTGDRITGFIEALGPVTRITQQSGPELEIETQRIESILIANTPAPEPGVYLGFSDREILRAMSIEYEAQQPITIEVDATSLGLSDTGNAVWVFDTGSLRSLRVVRPATRVLALAELDPARVQATGDRDWAPTPTPLDRGANHPALGSLDLHSPVRLFYRLPEGTARFAAGIEAPIEQWTDCIVRVLGVSGSDQRVLFEQRLNRESPTAELNIAVPARSTELIIEIDPGEYGPIQDRVLLHRARLLVQG